MKVSILNIPGFGFGGDGGNVTLQKYGSEGQSGSFVSESSCGLGVRDDGFQATGKVEGSSDESGSCSGVVGFSAWNVGTGRAQGLGIHLALHNGKPVLVSHINVGRTSS